MPRPRKCRRVGFLPGITYFKPAGIPLRELEENNLTIDEIESIRLKDIEDLEQEQCAVRMNVSRATFQRILGTARKNIADALLNGKAIKIQGGDFEVMSFPGRCIQNCSNDKQVITSKNEGGKTMKIAVVTDDGTSICQHFGRARYYTVMTVENGKVVSKEQRNKAEHHTAGAQHSSQASYGERHGFDATAQASHAGMMTNITDCQLLIAGGMGWGAHESLKNNGIESLITDVNDIDDAIQLFIQGKLPNLKERLH